MSIVTDQYVFKRASLAKAIESQSLQHEPETFHRMKPKTRLASSMYLASLLMPPYTTKLHIGRFFDVMEFSMTKPVRHMARILNLDLEKLQKEARRSPKKELDPLFMVHCARCGRNLYIKCGDSHRLIQRRK